MSEKNTPVIAFSITRNDTPWNVVETVKTRGAEGEKGAVFLKFEDITPDTLSTAIALLAPSMVCDILNAKLRQQGSVITEQATSDLDGKMDIGLAQKYFTEFSTRGETKAELEAKRDELCLSLTELFAAGDTAGAMKIGEEIKSILTAIESKKRERAPKSEAAASGN